MSLANRRQGRDRIAGPRAGKEPICAFLSEFGEETSAQKLEFEVLRQLIGLDLPNDQRISRLPGLRIISGEIAWIASTPRVFWAVIAVIAVIPWTRQAANAFRSAWIPAPPPESEPAIDSTLGISPLPGIARRA